MGRIAIAGGSGAVGKTFVEILLENNQHTLFIFSRSAPQNAPSPSSPIHLQIDYSDIPATSNLLEENAIDTIISAISIESEETSQSQLSLIAAADRSSTTTTFIPSEYGFIATPELTKLDPMIQLWIDNAEALSRTNLKWTRIANGFFLDYWGMPRIKTHLTPFPWAVDVLKKEAAIPGTGNEVISMTYSFDLARVIVRMLDIDDWPEFTVLVGEDVTFNELVRWAEEARDAKFDVKYDTEEKLEKDGATALQEPVRMATQDLCTLFGRIVIAGNLHLPNQGRVNGKFHGYELMTVRQMIRDVWTGQ